MMAFDIVVGVLAVRHFLERQVGNLRERVVETDGKLVFLRLESRYLTFQTRNFGQQRSSSCFLVALLRCPDLPRGSVAAR